MILSVRRQNTMLPIRWACQARSFKVLGHFLGRAAVAVDGLPCCGGDVGEFVGGDADDRTVLLVELCDALDGVTLNAFPDQGKAGCSVEFWARVGRERVQVDVVEDVAE